MLLLPDSDFDAQASPGVRALSGPVSSALDSLSTNLTIASDDGGLGSYTSVNGSAVFGPSQQRALQGVAFSVSSFGLIAAIFAIYWFCMMRRNFRRDLVLLLVIGGGWKSLWFVLYGAVAFSWGTVPSNGAVCRLTGYMLEVGFESCDLAIVMMSLHMLFQIFPPARSILAHDGLYRIRHWLLLLWIVIPNLLAGLAFINPVDPYTNIGGLCFLPIRPFWYRLALFWIPRYLIWIFITYVALKIYRHVGREFKVFAKVRDESGSIEIPGESTIDRAVQEAEQRAAAHRERARRKSSLNGLVAAIPEKSEREDSVSHNVDNSQSPSYPPTPGWAAYSFNDAVPPGTAEKVQSPSRRGSRPIASGVMAEDFAPTDPAQTEDLASDRLFPTAPPHAIPPRLRSAQVSQITTSSTGMSTDVPRDLANKAMEQRRLAIQRQLRLLFIYPCIYMLVWVIPSITHFMNYSDHFAQHPVFALSVLQIFCLTVMTPVDVAVFCWRERPWRHIPGADATFLGSFAFWRFTRQPEWQLERRLSRVHSASSGSAAGAAQPGDSASSHAGLLASLRRWPLSAGRRRRSSGAPSAPSYPSTQPHSPDQASFGPGAVLAGPPPPPAPATTATAAVAAAPPPSPATSLTLPPLAARRFRTGGSDRRQMAADRAYERLALERADYAAQQKARREGQRDSHSAAAHMAPVAEMDPRQQQQQPQVRLPSSTSSSPPLGPRRTAAPSRPSTKEWFETDLFADLAASRSLEEADGSPGGDLESDASKDLEKS